MLTVLHVIGLKVTPDKPLPEAIETKLLDQAAALITKALCMAKNEAEAPPPPAGGAAGGKKPAAAAADKKAPPGDRPGSPAASGPGGFVDGGRGREGEGRSES